MTKQMIKSKWNDIPGSLRLKATPYKRPSLLSVIGNEAPLIFASAAGFGTLAATATSKFFAPHEGGGVNMHLVSLLVIAFVLAVAYAYWSRQLSSKAAYNKRVSHVKAHPQVLLLEGRPHAALYPGDDHNAYVVHALCTDDRETLRLLKYRTRNRRLQYKVIREEALDSEPSIAALCAIELQEQAEALESESWSKSRDTAFQKEVTLAMEKEQASMDAAQLTHRRQELAAVLGEQAVSRK